ncbi:methylcobamide--CoM methyltransferase|uniref:[methyl-Co(III) methanol-specific corrinoid protein]:coenzyme M methyltransferase n=1 Tax=Dendrosporobacter quercicolus TaxID=146817 RepID=A0A1G9S4X4_9FIRM|nr:uroporphyrinogen decarboxylase family protein [Dendrosporobacter quercicolus]NSL49465.1 methylcobamide--CoM methyltransferase [Dendrosporobacter quercicolus DSM 1736]SDM30464.1 [methyl-Co(III) methanol-specific corrinoid protein]:coenzyme M methyltransferase [Dendrosporobacter quercicolus]
MSVLSPEERLTRVLAKQSTDRPPVICTGGMMNAAIVEVMSATGHSLPEAHSDAGLMAELALAVSRHTGFENLGIPFCMTVEAEVLGSEVTYGTLACEPKIVREIYASVNDVTLKNIPAMLEAGRMETVIQATYLLSKQQPDYPVIGNLTGPISTAASLVDPVPFLKELRKSRDGAHRVLDYVSDLLIGFAKELIDQGATAISIGDPTATGEILGPKMFEEYAVRYINKIISAVHAQGAPVIVHICGNMRSVWQLIPEIKANAISTDAIVDLQRLKCDFPSLTTMGNLSTYLLEYGPTEKVAERARILVGNGVDIISPACGLSTSTRLAHIQAMTAAVREE